jgi:pimeloyl-ACP methyl ester carboxylesterase
MEFTVRDLPIFYEVHGEGTPIVMIHGWSPDHRLMKGCMEPLFASLGAPWKRIYFDLPGMGKTPGRPWITGTDVVLGLILELIDGIIPDQNYLLAGESYGGYLARGIIRDRAAQVDGLLLICPSADQENHQANAPAFRVLEKDDTVLASLTPEERRYFEGIGVVQNQRVWARFRDEILPGLKVADYAFFDQSLRQNVSFATDVDLLGEPYARPTLMIMGRQDSVVGYRDQWKFIENYPRGTFAILDKAGHNAQIEQDGLFQALVHEWLGRVQAERR